MAFIAVGLVFVLIDIFLAGQSYLLGVGIGFSLTAVCIKLCGITSASTALLLASALSMIAVLVIKRFLSYSNLKKDINNY